MRRFLIVDNNIIYRSSLSEIIYTLSSNNVVFEIETLEKAVEISEKYQEINILIVSSFEFKDSELTLIESMKDNNPNIRLLAIINNCTTENVEKLINVGFLGVVSHLSNHSNMKAAISSVINGEQFVCDSTMRRNVDEMADNAQHNGQLSKTKSRLTSRQQQVLDYIVKGYANKLIAYELGVSEGTVKLHVSSILRALKVTNRTEAAMRAGQLMNLHAH